MPLFRVPDTQTLENHFFGSGAFQWDWFTYINPTIRIDDEGKLVNTFPVVVLELDEDRAIESRKLITEEMFVEGIKKFAAILPDRSFDDLIEDMDAVDVDNVIQLIMFGEIRYA